MGHLVEEQAVGEGDLLAAGLGTLREERGGGRRRGLGLRRTASRGTASRRTASPGRGREQAERVLAVDQRDQRVEAQPVPEVGVPQQGLHHRAGARDTGGLDEHAVESRRPREQRPQRPPQVLPHRAAEAAVLEHDDLLLAALQEQLVVDRLLAQLVLDDEQLLAVLLAQDPIEQRRLASTQEARHDRHGQPTVGRARVLLPSG